MAEPTQNESVVTGSPSDGYYRDQRARGLKSGRLSPRIPIRLPARDQIHLARGLSSYGDVHMAQGMLFHPDDPSVQPMRTDAEAAEAEGVPRLRPSSAPGFMSGLTGSPTGRVTAHEQKINAIKAFVGNSTLSDNTIRGAVQSVESHIHNGTRGEWYDGKAADAIVSVTNSVNQGLDRLNHINAHQMRRATAHFSAQRPWDSGHAQDGTYKVENVTNLSGLPKHLEQGGEAENYRIQATHKGFPVAGETKMPQTKDAMRKAGNALSTDGSPEATSAPHDSPADKVATFDSALGMGLVRTNAARRHLSDAMTIDTHQAAAAGQANYDVVSNVVGGYDITAMVNRRAFLREGVRSIKRGEKPMLPIEGQSHTWDDVRPTPGLAHMSLFQEKDGKIVPNDFDKVQKWSDEADKITTEGRPSKKSKE